MKFENAQYLYFALLLFPLTAVFLWFMMWQKRALQRLGQPDLIRRLMPDRPGSSRWVRFGLFAGAYLFLVLALANPQIGTKYEKVSRKGADLIIGLDISNSMLAEDVRPSRLERARQFLTKLNASMAGHRVGVILFAGNAYLQVPVTADYSAVQLFLKTISTELAPTQGTAIGDAIRLGTESLQQKNKAAPGAILILSDGEDHEGNAVEAAQEAAEAGIRVFTMGIGTAEGGPIPQFSGGAQMDYKRDKDGQLIFSRLEPGNLQAIADAGNGRYLSFSGGDRDVREILKILSNLEQTDFEDKVFVEYADQFQYFLAIAILLLLVEMFMGEKRSRWFSGWRIFKTEKQDA
jgi:Ca-activated chloride channel family protein